MRLEPGDDLRHRPAPGHRMRDSLFWEIVVPEEQVGMQVYLYLTDRGRAGYNVVMWGAEPEPIALKLGTGGSRTPTISTSSPSRVCICVSTSP